MIGKVSGWRLALPMPVGTKTSARTETFPSLLVSRAGFEPRSANRPRTAQANPARAGLGFRPAMGVVKLPGEEQC